MTRFRKRLGKNIINEVNELIALHNKKPKDPDDNPPADNDDSANQESKEQNHKLSEEETATECSATEINEDVKNSGKLILDLERPVKLL